LKAARASGKSQIFPIAYLPGNSLRIRVRVAGALDRIEASREVA
jgi:hypothetical protein